VVTTVSQAHGRFLTDELDNRVGDAEEPSVSFDADETPVGIARAYLRPKRPTVKTQPYGRDAELGHSRDRDLTPGSGLPQWCIGMSMPGMDMPLPPGPIAPTFWIKTDTSRVPAFSNDKVSGKDWPSFKGWARPVSMMW